MYIHHLILVHVHIYHLIIVHVQFSALHKAGKQGAAPRYFSKHPAMRPALKIINRLTAKLIFANYTVNVELNQQEAVISIQVYKTGYNWFSVLILYCNDYIIRNSLFC